MRYTFKTIGIVLISSTLLCLVLILLGRPAVARAYSAAELEARMPDARNIIINGMETPCFNDLVNENGIDRRGGDTDRDNVNDSNPYRDHEWISPLGIPAQTSITIPAGTRAVNLQLNKMLFVCAALVESNTTTPSDIDDGSSIVTYGPPTNFANDRKPNSTSLSPTTHRASLTGVNTRVNSASVVSGGGSVNLTPGSTLPIPRDNDSRYWFAGPIAFTYDAGGPMLSSRTIRIQLNVSHIRSYGGVHQCANPGGGAPLNVGSNTNFAPCATGPVDILFTIIVDGGPIGVHDGVSCDLNNFANGWAFDPDSTSTSIRVHVYIDQPAGSPGTIGPGPGAEGTGMADKPSGGQNSPPDDVNGAYGISGNHRFVIPFADLNLAQRTALNSPGNHNVYIYSIGVDSSGNVDNLGNALLSGSPKVYNPANCPPTPSCGNVTTVPSEPEIITPFNVKFNFNTTPVSYNQTYSVNLTLDNPPGGSNPGVMAVLSANPVPGSITTGSSGGSATFTVSTPVAGQYRGNFRVTLSGGQVHNCPFGPGLGLPPILVGTIPYFRTYGGDTLAGPAGVSCLSSGWGTGNGNGGIYGINNAGFGAGSQLAAMALATIEGFTSATGRTSPPLPPTGLSFANSPANPPAYGGGFTRNSCPPASYFVAPGGATAVSGSINLSGKDGKYSSTGSLTVSGSNNISQGKKILLFVDGNVTITDDITYVSLGGWKIDTVPSLTIVATGDINIDFGVQQISGLFVSKNTIRTCTNGSNPYGTLPLEKQAMITACSSQLRIFGSFLAANVKLLRLANSAANGDPGETYATSEAAEIFVFGPEAWLTNSAIPPDGGPGSYNSITNLPPVL